MPQRLKLLHTADWHLGRRFGRFEREQELVLTRARLQAVERVFKLAAAQQVDAVLCAGDLFDDPVPRREWWEGLLVLLQQRTDPARPILLLPGNHDPLTPDSVYHPQHAFRSGLPRHVEVADTEGWSRPLGEAAVVYAVPCRSRAGETDPLDAIPTRTPNDRRIRIALIHGSTTDVEGFEARFPIEVGKAAGLGLDYVALGDTHSFRVVETEPVPAVYPGAPEATGFKEADPGNVAIVILAHNQTPFVRKVRVGRWRWREERCTRPAELRRLLEVGDLEHTVLRLILEMEANLAEQAEVERILDRLQGTEAHPGEVGILELDRRGLSLRPDRVETELPDDLPDLLQEAAQRLQQECETGPEPEVARQALYHLWRLIREEEPTDG